MVKREYLKHLYRRSENLTTQLRFEHFLQRLLDRTAPNIDPKRMILANRGWLDAHRRLPHQAEYQD